MRDEDTAADIKRCLNCAKPECTNCLANTPADQAYRAMKYRERRERLGIQPEPRKPKVKEGPSKRELYEQRLMQDLASVAELVPQGYSDSEIGARLGISRTTAAKYRSLQGLPSGPQIKRNALIMQYYNAGYSFSAIAEKAECSRQTVTSYLRGLGLCG